jgi:uroporphyrinogen decarboxylase
MTSEERVLKSLHHEEPDRVPVGEAGIDAHITERVLGHRTHYRGGWWSQIAVWEGRIQEVMENELEDLVSLYTRLDYDVVPIFLGPNPADYKPRKIVRLDETTIEVDGARYGLSPQTNTYVAYPKEVSRDLTQWREGPPYQSPPEAAWGFFDTLVRRLPDRFLLARSVSGFFPMYAAGSMPDCLTAYLTHPKECHAVTRHQCRHACALAQEFIRHGADAVFIGGDYCDSRAPMISPAMFREHIFPYLKELCAAIHDAGGYALKHTDGQTWPLLDMFAEAGVDMLQAIQPSAGMDIRRLKERYGNTFTFMGAIDCDTLVRGTPEQVRREVDYNLCWASPGGGHILCSGNTIQYGVPWENFETMLGRVREKGRYPIDRGGLEPATMYV